MTVVQQAYIKKAGTIVLTVMFLLSAITLVSAQSRRGGLPLVRDAEIEALIRDYTAPIFKVAGLRRNSVEVFLLNRNEFNAFVTGSRMFINTGAIMQADTPNEIIGVFAHETGHILGGHLTRLRDRIEKAQSLALLGMLAGIGASVSGNSAAGSAIISGSQSVAGRSILAYQRDEELAADRTGATLLAKSGQSGLGMLNTFKRLGGNSLFSSGSIDPYAVSHPLPRQRIALLETVVRQSPHFGKTDSAQLQLRHDMARAKIAAYAGQVNTLRSIFRKNLNGPAATYGNAIATFLRGAPNKAIPAIDRLIKQQPKNPYLYEMKREMLLKSGKVTPAVKAFEKAVKLEKGKSGLLRIQLGHALLETNNSKNIDKAIKTLKAGLSRDRYSSNGYGYLARAYAKKGNQVLAIAATAEERFLQGRHKEAKQFARRAQPKVKTGSPQWLRLQDILEYKSPKK